MLLTEILKLREIDTNNMKIIRHTTNRKYIKELIDSGNFELYQSVQKTNILKGINYFISFTDMQGTKALLHGFYKINGVEEITELPKELDSIKGPESWGKGPYYRYNLERVHSLNDMEGRLVIDWGNATLSWHQRKLDKEIIESLPKGFVSIFPGYHNVVLSYDELSKIINNPNANKQWKMMLSNVCGVYVILDKKNGQQYIGSAYGDEGIWGRWSHYVKSKDGDNKKLIELIEKNPLRYKDFQFGIINVLPNSALNKEVIELESITKEKFGTRVFGFNGN